MIQNNTQLSSLGNHLKAFLLGLCILMFIVFTHFQESMSIISKIDTEAQITPYLVNFKNWSTTVSIASFGFVFFHYLQSKSATLLGILFILTMGMLAPLSMAFGLYFIIQHSYNAWSHLKKGLNLSSRVLYLKSLPFTLGALLIFCLMAFFQTNTRDLTGFWAIFFVFIACVSLPHFVLMHLFYTSKSN